MKQNIDEFYAWIRNREKLMLALCICSQIGILLFLTIRSSIPLLTGDSVLLQVVPIDPRDMFRGDYFTLAYDFTRQAPNTNLGNRNGDQNSVGETVYVALIKNSDGKHWHSGNVTYDPPAGGKYLRGKIAANNRVECGTESFFVQEGRGKEYEAAATNHKLWAELSVTKTGEASVRGLHIQ